MIIWAILIFWASGVRPNHNGENVSLQTFQVGDDVTVKCFLINSSSNSAVWFKQSIGQIPRPIAISYNYWKNAQFVDEFKNGRFNILASEGSFHLHITAMTKEDIGIYYCGTVFLNLIKFISGAYLTLKGAESKDFNMAFGETPVVNGTTCNTDSNNQKVWDPVLLCLISFNVVFVIVIIVLLVEHRKCWGKRHKASLSCEIEDSAVNYAAVSFASVPPARRSNNRHLAEYSEVHCKSTNHMI